MIYILLLYLLLIRPTPGVPSIELNPSDPQGMNQLRISECIALAHKCIVWYAPGTYHITRPIFLQRGVREVYGGGSIMIPCSVTMTHLFGVEAYLGAEDVPVFHDLHVDDTQPCGGHTPPMAQMIMYGVNPPPPYGLRAIPH